MPTKGPGERRELPQRPKTILAHFNHHRTLLVELKVCMYCLWITTSSQHSANRAIADAYNIRISQLLHLDSSTLNSFFWEHFAKIVNP